MVAMRFEQVQRFILAKKIFWVRGTLKTYLKNSFSKQADCSLTTGFSGPKSSRDFREIGLWT